MDKEKNKGTEPKAALGEYARELPDGLHGRVMASVRADKARRGEYRRLRITAVLAAAMLCIFAVSSAFLVMPFLKGNISGNISDANDPIAAGTCCGTDNNQEVVGTLSGVQPSAPNCSVQQSADTVAPVPPIYNGEAVEGVIPTSKPDNDVISGSTHTDKEPSVNENTDAILKPTNAWEAKTETEKTDVLSSSSNANTGNAALTATVIISGISSVAAIIVTLVQRRKLKSRERRKGQKND